MFELPCITRDGGGGAKSALQAKWVTVKHRRPRPTCAKHQFTIPQFSVAGSRVVSSKYAMIGLYDASALQDVLDLKALDFTHEIGRAHV